MAKAKLSTLRPPLSPVSNAGFGASNAPDPHQDLSLQRAAAQYNQQDPTLSPRQKALRKRKVGKGKQRKGFDMYVFFNQFVDTVAAQNKCAQSDFMMWLAMQGLNASKPTEFKESLSPTRSLRFELSWSNPQELEAAIAKWQKPQ